MIALISILNMIINVIVMLVIIQFVIGLLFAFNVINRSNEFLAQVFNSINALLEPLLKPIRRFLPATGSIDFSPLVLILLLNGIVIILSSLA
ncbi:YggT family protein [Altererythrobacter aurantiacus]|uniref:YggT family protein n=1 Tax=Parapontixanthobacter aurantiacus TaxID=1463599 RepID=A0A844ZDH5_9SPHN|nr:YggT family protein [Parapontixanthobacter aurantiacus]MXO86591.1 YggT family protein [Parapontixanthobacter aurantiacus]